MSTCAAEDEASEHGATTAALPACGAGTTHIVVLRRVEARLPQSLLVIAWAFHFVHLTLYKLEGRFRVVMHVNVLQSDATTTESLSPSKQYKIPPPSTAATW